MRRWAVFCQFVLRRGTCTLDSCQCMGHWQVYLNTLPSHPGFPTPCMQGDEEAALSAQREAGDREHLHNLLSCPSAAHALAAAAATPTATVRGRQHGALN